MNKHLELFEYIKEELIKWKHKPTNPTIDGIGFNDDQVKEITGSIPSANEFDYVYISPPIINQSGLTTGTRGVQRSTQTFTIDVYCRRDGRGIAAKKDTLVAIHENTNFISNLVAKQGFIITMPNADLDFNNNGTARQIMNITKVFIK